MPHQIDRTKSAFQNLIDLVNTGSTYVFTGSEVTNGAPSEYIPESPDTSNTEITLTAVPGSGFNGAKTIRYRRLELGYTKTAAPTTYAVELADDRSSIEQKIAIDHNLVIGQFNLVGDIPTPGGSDTICTIEAVNDSILYFGTSSITLQAPAAPPSQNWKFKANNASPTYGTQYFADFPSGMPSGGNSWDTNQYGVNGIYNVFNSPRQIEFSGESSALQSALDPNSSGTKFIEFEIIQAGTVKGAIGMFNSVVFMYNKDNYLGNALSTGVNIAWYSNDGDWNGHYSDPENVALLPTFTTGDVIGMVFDTTSVYFYKNGVQVATTSIGGSGTGYPFASANVS